MFYREEESACPDGEMEIEFTLEFDGAHKDENRVVIFKDRGLPTEEVVFDSDVDHDDGVAAGLQTIMAVVSTIVGCSTVLPICVGLKARLCDHVILQDFCAVESSEYIYQVLDTASNGFSDGGEALVYQNGVLLGGISGDFGSVAEIVIPAIVESEAPSLSPTGHPSQFPSITPTNKPSESVITRAPTVMPTGTPTAAPINVPTAAPTNAPTSAPVATPTFIPTNSPVPVQGTIVDFVIGTGILSFLEAALAAAGLNVDLTAAGPFLLVAPTDDAFEKFTMFHPELAAVLLEPEWKEHLRNLLLLHASSEPSLLGDVVNGVVRLPMLSNRGVTVAMRGGRPYAFYPTVGGASALVVQEVEPSNGEIAIVDRVLHPEFLSFDVVSLSRRLYPVFSSLLVETGLDAVILNGFGYTVSDYVCAGGARRHKVVSFF